MHITDGTETTFQEFTFCVEAAKVEEFCFALRETNPAVLDEESARLAGLGGTVAPPTFLSSSIQTGINGINPVEALGISRARALHAGQDYEFVDIVWVGDVLTGHTVVTGVVEKQGRSGTLRFHTLETRFSREGTVVVVVRTRVAERVA